MAKKKMTMKRKMNKPIGVTKIPKGNKAKIKAGVALVYGTKAKPKLGSKRFKTISNANKYAKKMG